VLSVPSLRSCELLCAPRQSMINTPSHIMTGYVGHDVTLPCSFIQGTNDSNVTQSHQWDFLSPDGNKTLILVFNKQHGKGVHESHLKGRVDMDDQLLQIKNVELSDAGSYICTINTYPLGSFHDTTQLHVQSEPGVGNLWLF
uniref:Ig-like domain-containing protein n=1 Tax=Oryzias latipes TaxID=8090 RepID=A0A3B3IKP2_ORYLA